MLALAGRFQAREALEQVSEAFGDWAQEAGGPSVGGSGQTWPFVPLPSLEGHGPRVVSVRDSDSQLRMQLSFRTNGYRSEEEIPLALLCSLLDDGPNTRLQRIVREEHALVYHIGCGYTAYADAGQIDIYTAVAPDRYERLLETLFGVLRDLVNGGVDGDEVQALQRRYRYEMEFSKDSLEAAIDRHAWPLLYSRVRSEEEERKIVEETTAARLTELARAVFRPAAACAALVGPVNSDTENLLRQHLLTL